jgi:long-subunit fatty acid transport protein
MLIKAKSLIGISLMLVLHQLSAQNLTKSPYSSIGLGDIQFSGSAWMHAMGQINQGISDPYSINNQNPASYSSFALTTWDFAGTLTTGTISTTNNKSYNYTGSLAYFALGVPLSQKLNWGFSLGLMPYSSVGYNVSRNVVQTTFSGVETITGTGGTSKFYLGTGIRIYKGLSLGVNGVYLFGKTEKNLLLNIPRSYNTYNLAESRVSHIGDVIIDLGLQYKDTFTYKENKYSWGIGATLSPENGVSTSSNYSVRTLGVGITDPNSVGKDTIASGSNEKGEIVIPTLLQTGVYFSKTDYWRVGLDVAYQNWKNYQEFSLRDSLKNNFTIKIGGGYTPDASDAKRFLKRIEYRAGFRMDNGNLALNGHNISTYAISAGLGLPLGKSKSKLNLSAEYIVRGTTQDKLIKEEYFKFTIGVLISDKWFQQYRYD